MWSKCYELLPEESIANYQSSEIDTSRRVPPCIATLDNLREVLRWEPVDADAAEANRDLSLLHWALIGGYTLCVRSIIESRADVVSSVPIGICELPARIPPTCLAVIGGPDGSTLKILLDARADPRSTFGGFPLLTWILWFNSVDAIHVLLDRYPSI